MSTLKLVIVGHVDHGKSTLVGRLLHETGALPDGKVKAVQAMSEKRGMPFEWAFVIDSMQAERDQGITIDTTQIRFRSPQREYVLIDAPGHKQFLKNMVSGAASADAVVLVVDALEGVQEQSRRHAYLLRLLGIRKIVVAVNKMDLVQHREERFREVAHEVRGYLASIGVAAADIAYVPLAARTGANLVRREASLSWYDGPTLLEALDALSPPAPAADLPLRMWVQDVYKFDERRIIAGRIESGQLRVGDTLLFSPSNATARVASLERWNAPAQIAAGAGASVGFTLDEDIFVERGQLAGHVHSAPMVTNVFRARLFWLGRRPLVAGTQYRLRSGATEALALVERIERILDTNDLSSREGGEVPAGAIAEAVIRVRGMLALDDHAEHPITGRFVLLEGSHIVGGGTASTGGYPDQRQAAAPKSGNLFAVEHRVAAADRARMNGHRGAILWFTGLSGAGKSTLAVELERLLFAKGYQAFLIDGDNLRRGLNADLGFSPAERSENVRRVGEVAGLFAEAGMIVISAFISPYRADRDRVRAAHGAHFHEIYINAPLEVCEARDAKGLYQRARAGEIKEFTGVSAPYEPPLAPQLEIRTSEWPVARCIAELAVYVQQRLAVPASEALRRSRVVGA
jgi:bifunctional enzyme CysN/CysC